MNAADLAPIVSAVTAGIGLVLTGLISVYVPKAIAAFEVRTGMHLTDQQTAALMAAAMTAKGIVETKLDQGILTRFNVTQADPAIRAEATAAISRVPLAAFERGRGIDWMAATIVGLAETNRAPAPAALMRHD